MVRTYTAVGRVTVQIGGRPTVVSMGQTVQMTEEEAAPVARMLREVPDGTVSKLKDCGCGIEPLQGE